MRADRAGLMIIRAYVEHDSSSPLRVLVRLTTDVSTGFDRTLVLARDDAVLGVVQGWLDEMAADTAD